MMEKLSPSAEAHLLVAAEYARLGVLDFAQKRIALALKLDPSFGAAHEMMARLWRDWGQPDVALPHALRAIHYAPGAASAQNTLGTVLEALGRAEAARESFLRALTLDPEAGWTLINLCYFVFRRVQFEEAQKFCEAALRATPDLREAHNNLGLVYAASGDLSGAETAFRGGGDSASAYYNMGIVHLAAGRFDEAAAAFAAALKERPNFTAAKGRAHESKMRALRVNYRKQP
jgi:Tfp pilus assembly protein PilF